MRYPKAKNDWPARFHPVLTLCALLLSCPVPAPAAEQSLIYTNHLESAQIDSLPEGFTALNGDFKVRSLETNRLIELPGAPLETFGLLFGPTFDPKAGLPAVGAQARIQGLAQGRRYPAFGLGVCGLGGYRLLVVPAKQKLELYKGDRLLSDTSYTWRPDTWTTLRLELIRQDNQWLVRGKAWTNAEPEQWSVSQTTQDTLFPGQASLWGIPYSGRPIYFDDLAVYQPPDS